MNMFIKFDPAYLPMEEPLYVNPKTVTAIRRISDNTCGIFTTGGQRFNVASSTEEAVERLQNGE